MKSSSESSSGKSWWRRGRVTVLFWLPLAALLLFNALGAEFDDEWDNLVGGLLLTEGRVLYRDFFSHHFPLPYLLSAFYQLFIERDPLLSRCVYGLTLLLLLSLCDLLIGVRDSAFVRRSAFLSFALLAPVLWTQMLIAESLAFYLLAAAALVLLIPGEQKRGSDGIVLGGLGALLMLTSQAYVPLGAAVALLGIGGSFRFGRRSRLILFSCLAAVLGPLALFAVYLWSSAALDDFAFQTFVFNREHYFKFAVGPGDTPGVVLLNLVRRPILAIISMLSWQGHETSRLVYFILGLSGLALLVSVWLERRRGVAVLLAALWMLSMTRFNTGAVFWEIHNSVGLVIPVLGWSVLALRGAQYWRRGGRAAAGLAGALPLLLALPLLTKLPAEWSARLRGEWISVSDPMAQKLESLVPEGQSYWSGPFLFRTIFFTRRQLASRYTFFMPWHAHSRRVSQELWRDLRRERPAVVLFQGAFATWGSAPAYQYASEIYGFLEQRYSKRPAVDLADFYFASK